MRTLTSFLFMSLDGVVEAPATFVRPELYADFGPVIAESIAGQDGVLLGRMIYEEWSAFWPTSEIQPFSGFINNVPKFVVSKTLVRVDWQGSTILRGPLDAEVVRLKNSGGGTIGVHGITLIESLLIAGLMDELRFVVCPVVAGRGRRLLGDRHGPIQLDLRSAHSTPTGLQLLVYRPR